MKKNLIILCIVTLMFLLGCAVSKLGLTLDERKFFEENGFPTRDSTHIFWQPDVKLTPNDFQGQPVEDLNSYMNENGLTAIAYIGIWSVLDVPKNEDERWSKQEKVYFAPAFERTSSYILREDMESIEIQRMYFDIAEICARWARRELYQPLDTLVVETGTLSIFYMTIEKKMQEMYSDFCHGYTQEVIVEKKENSYNEWRTTVDSLLNENKKWKTTPEECYRFVSKLPVEPGYIMAPTVMEPLFD